LTPAELRVLEELRQGGTNAEIAIRLGLSPETVKTHIASMLSKLDLGDRRELAAWQPPEESARWHILRVLGAPSMLFLLKRPLVCAAAGLAGVAGIAATALFIAAMLANGGLPATVPPECSAPADVTPQPSTTFPPTTPLGPDMIVVSDGSHDALLLQWTGGPENASEWQYRLRRWESAEPLDWEEWTDVPDSMGTTHCYLVTGLKEDTTYDFEVRGVVGLPGGAEAYEAFPAAKTGATHRRGELPVLRAGRIAQGDGVREWVVADFTITIPAGMRATTVTPEASVAGEATVSVLESASGSSLQFTRSGDLVEWVVYSSLSFLWERPRPLALDGVTPLPSDVNALFEQIVASVRSLVPTAVAAESSASTLPAPYLLVFSDGSTDALWIEWQGSSEDVTGWQYRMLVWEDGASFVWREWTDTPRAATAARRYRVTGLDHNTAYEIQVRPLRGAAPPGAAIAVGDISLGSRSTDWGITNSPGRLPYLHQHTAAEGDGSTEWKPHGELFLFTIPAGMQVLGGFAQRDSGFLTALTDIATGSVLLFAGGEEWSRTIRAPHVNALFDQIVASFRDCGPVCSSPPNPLAFSDGAPDSLLLDWGSEWSGLQGLTGWQYRLRPYRLRPGGWSDWTDFPDSRGSSRRGRVPGLRPNTLYQFEVRAVVGARAGDTSARTRGLTQPATGLRLIQSGYPVVGDGRTEWRLPGGHIAVTIPSSMLVADDGHARGGLRDLDSGSWLLLNLTTGAEIRREVHNAVEGEREVDDLFDQIVASARVVGSEE
jgi:DNA-binding CsgD family transcriptional regulator